ncbi:MAG: PD-(D/E)XK nuclease family protein, partial [Pseudomonadota bacterium]
ALLDGLLRAETLRAEGARPHPRVFLWGTIEARAGTADLTILAGLNEGSWPGVADTGPWLSRPMRRALGLPSPEREIGLSAHDFLQAAARPDVLLTRSTTVEGVPQLASRWLVRLETLLAGTAPDALEAMRARGRRFGDLVARLDRADPTDPALAPAPRPCPAPPVALRPRQLSVTAIETLIRDPYAVYARRVLGLRPLEPLGAALDARDRGEAFHEVMRDFVEQTADGLPDFEDAIMLLHDLATQAMAERDVPADLAALWTARFGSVANRLVAMETELRLRAQPAAQERQGRISVPAPAGAIDLTARADRIDLGDTGGFIYDYKTGQPPSRKQIGRFNHQLHLQGLILAEGGFEDLGAAQPIDGAYIGLANAKAVPPQDPLSEALEPYRERLLRLLASYDDPTRGYLSRQVPLRRDEEGDYDHLARRSEWDGRDDDNAGAAS